MIGDGAALGSPASSARPAIIVGGLALAGAGLGYAVRRDAIGAGVGLAGALAIAFALGRGWIQAPALGMK